MELVPFDASWSGSQTKLDLKAWYRRTSVHGGFSIVGPFPVRRHMDYVRKGFDYVTLATAQDFGLVVPTLKAQGFDVHEMFKAYDHRGNFKTDEYLKDQKQKTDTFLVELQAKVDKHGVDTVTDMMQMNDPSFVMPASIAVPVKAVKK